MAGVPADAEPGAEIGDTTGAIIAGPALRPGAAHKVSAAAWECAEVLQGVPVAWAPVECAQAADAVWVRDSAPAEWACAPEWAGAVKWVWRVS
jgi:hypothetical protein